MVNDGTIFELAWTEYFARVPEWLFNDMLVMAFSVVLWTLLVQGLTLKPMMRKLKVTDNLPESELSYGVALAESIATKAALDKLGKLYGKGMVSDEDMKLMHEVLKDRQFAADASVTELSKTSVIHRQRMESTRMELLMAQIAAITEANTSGLLSDKVADSASAALMEKLHESQEKQEEKSAKEE